MTREEYPCKHCKYGIYTIIDKKWWCNLYDMYALQVARNISETSKHRKAEKNETVCSICKKMVNIGEQTKVYIHWSLQKKW